MTDTGAVYPLGHFIGAAGAPENTAPVYTIRIGWDLVDLQSPLHLELWLLAHGEPDHNWSMPWNKTTIIERYSDPDRRRETFVKLDHTPRETDLARIERFFDALVDASVLVNVDPVADPKHADRFLRHHRFVPQLTGLGEQADAPGMERIGLQDEPMLHVTRTVADAWRAAPQFSDLAKMRDIVAVPGEPDTSARDARQLLSDLRVFLMYGAGYFDRSMAYADEAQERYDARAQAQAGSGHTPPAADATSTPPAGAASEPPPADAESDAASGPGRWAVLPELVSGSRLSPKAVTENLYRARVTGQDIPFDYLVADPSTGEDVKFHSIAHGVLIYTIFRKKLSTDYRGMARSQVSVAAGRPIEWLVQDAKSAESIRSTLQKAGVTEITVTHRSYPHN